MRVLIFTGLALLSLPCVAETINVNPSEKVSQIVAAAPAGTTFNFAAGYYRTEQIVPKTGDTFVGPASGTAYLDGGKPITFTSVSGSSPALWSSKIGANPLDSGRCQPNITLCHLTRELFVDSRLLTPVTSKSQLSKTTWFYDSSTGEAVINFTPGQQLFLIGTPVCAFCGYANNVTVKNLTVQRYAAPSSSGAIGQNGTGTHWMVDNVVGQYNHGAAVQLGPNGTVQNSTLNHNGQKGVGASGANITVENNEIAYNGYANFDYGWEAGGAKFGSLDTAEITNNNVHDNNGVGLWDDSNGIYVHYKGNTVVNNAQDGIKHEVGFNAVIEENTITRNGLPPRSSLWSAQINVQNSSYVTVQNNTVIVAADYGSGIVIINQVRTPASGKYGAYVGANDIVQNNDITFEGTLGSNGIMGVTSTATGNEVDNNTYHINPTLNKQHFQAFGVVTFPQYQAKGYDQHSSISWSNTLK